MIDEKKLNATLKSFNDRIKKLEIESNIKKEQEEYYKRAIEEVEESMSYADMLGLDY